MNKSEISICSKANAVQASNSAARIANLLEVTLVDCEHAKNCEAELSLVRFDNGANKAIVTAELAGTINGKKIKFSEKYDYNAQNHSQLSMIARSPVFGIVLSAVEMACNEADPKINADQQLARAEFEIASKMIRRLQHAISAPVNFVTSFWYKVLWMSGTVYLSSLAAMAFMFYRRVQARNMESAENLLMSLFIATVFAFPAGVGAVFLGLLVAHPSNIATSIHGQALFRFVGVQSRWGLIVVSAAGAVIGLGIYGIVLWNLI